VDQGISAKFREVDGVPQNCEVAAMSPNSVRWSERMRAPARRVGFIAREVSDRDAQLLDGEVLTVEILDPNPL